MHTFESKGELVVFYDAFGLSTLDLRTGKLKTDKAISGRWFSANGGTALVHNVRASARLVRTLPGLATGKLAEPSKGNAADLRNHRVAVLADGKRAAYAGSDGIHVISLATGAEKILPLDTGKKLEPFTLGPRLDPYVERHTRSFVGADDSFAIFTSQGTLFGGQLSKSGVQKPWSVKSGLPQGRVTAIPHASGTFVSAWHPALQRSFCAVMAGKATAREVDCISPATWSGEALVYQSSPGEVVREPLSGGKAERFQLPKNAHGAGEVMAHGSKIFFIPFDRARVIDVVSGKVFDRKLGSNLIELRTAFLEYERRFNELGRASNLSIQLNAFNKPAHGRGNSPGFDWDHGDLGFGRLAISGWLVHSLETEQQGRWQLGSYALPTSLRPIGAKELVRDFEMLDRGSISLFAGIRFLQHPLSGVYGGEVTKQMEPEAAHVLLWALIEQLRSPTRVELAKNAPKWAKQKLTPEIFVKQFDPGVERDGWRHAQIGAACLVLEFFGARAVTVFSDWVTRRATGARTDLMDASQEPMRRMVKQFPETKKPLAAALLAAEKVTGPEDKGSFSEIERSLSR